MRLTILLSLILLTTVVNAQKFRHVKKNPVKTEVKTDDLVSEPESPVCSLPIDTLAPDAVVESLYSNYPPMVWSPLVFSGYRTLAHSKRIPQIPPLDYGRIVATLIADSIREKNHEIIPESILHDEQESPLFSDSVFNVLPEPADLPNYEALQALTGDAIPYWLASAIRAREIFSDMQYEHMVRKPLDIDYAYWDLPVPPTLPKDDKNYDNYLRRLNFIPQLTPTEKIETTPTDRTNWLHYFNVGLQFSQAYISSNWYQGGNNYLALLFNFIWNVDLNTVYYPNRLFQSSLSYKLSLNSSPKGSLHKYSISQDQFQYNLKLGLKAFNYWFYSFTLQFNTPIFNAYPDDSSTRSGAFLSPGSLNLGLGMTFNRENTKKTFKLSASIAPISYNLKTCIADDVEHTQYSIPVNAHTTSEIGSNLEANMVWKISNNILWTSRLFLFSDYKYFLADWENTINFTINRFLSTQIYFRPRYDSSSDFNTSKWHYWMFKEILSFGLSYTFSTKG